MKRRPLLYIAAPYTRDDPVQNTNAVCRVATVVAEQTPYTPFVPHLTLLWHAISPHSIDFWYELDLQYLLRCDAIVRLPGRSTGADREVEAAAEADIQHLPYEHLPNAAMALWETLSASAPVLS